MEPPKKILSPFGSAVVPLLLGLLKFSLARNQSFPDSNRLDGK